MLQLHTAQSVRAWLWCTKQAICSLRNGQGTTVKHKGEIACSEKVKICTAVPMSYMLQLFQPSVITSHLCYPRPWHQHSLLPFAAYLRHLLT